MQTPIPIACFDEQERDALLAAPASRVSLSAAEVEIVLVILRGSPQYSARNQKSVSVVPDFCGNAVAILDDARRWSFT